VVVLPVLTEGCPLQSVAVEKHFLTFCNVGNCTGCELGLVDIQYSDLDIFSSAIF